MPEAHGWGTTIRNWPMRLDATDIVRVGNHEKLMGLGRLHPDYKKDVVNFAGYPKFDLNIMLSLSYNSRVEPEDLLRLPAGTHLYVTGQVGLNIYNGSIRELRERKFELELKDAHFDPTFGYISPLRQFVSSEHDERLRAYAGNEQARTVVSIRAGMPAKRGVRGA